MTKIQVNELQTTQSEFNLLSDRQTSAVVGGNSFDREIRNTFGGINVSNIFQINNNISINIAFDGDIFNVNNQTNNAGANQS